MTISDTVEFGVFSLEAIRRVVVNALGPRPGVESCIWTTLPRVIGVAGAISVICMSKREKKLLGTTKSVAAMSATLSDPTVQGVMTVMFT